MTSPAERLDLALESALGAAHAALRGLEAAEPTAATLPAARSVRRAIGALLDAIDGRTTLRSSLDRAASTLTFAMATLGGEGEAAADADDTAGDAAGEAEVDAPSPHLLAIERAAAATLEATQLVPPERLDAPPPRAPERALPRWRVADHEPRVVDVPRRSLLPPDAIRLPPETPPPRPRATAAKVDDGIPGLDERALLAQAAQLGVDGAALGASTSEAAAAALGAVSKGDLEVGSALDDAPPIMTEAGFVRAIARELFEDIGMFGLQRLPLFGDDFAEVEAIESRLLASCDALIGLGAAHLHELERLARDTPAPDPMRVFAMGFVAGSLEGRDGLAAAERVLYAHDPHDEGIADALGAAFALAPNPLVDRVLAGLARAEEPPVRAAALRALARRGPVDVALLFDAADSGLPAVVAAALPVLAVARHPHALELVGQIAAREATSDDRDVAIALWEALALSGHEEAASAPRSRLGGPLEAPAAIALAVLADADDAAALLARARAAPSPALLTALGWAGDLEAAPFLIELLGHEDHALPAARALDRLLGGALLAPLEVDPESLALMEPVALRSPGLLPRSPVAAAIQATDEDPEASLDRILLPTTDPVPWKRRLDEVRASLPRRGEGLRTRHGLPWTPAAAHAELGRTGADLCPSFAERGLLVREIGARTGRPLAFSAEDLVVVQRRKLTDCQSSLGSAAPGSFARAIRGGQG